MFSVVFTGIGKLSKGMFMFPLKTLPKPIPIKKSQRDGYSITETTRDLELTRLLSRL